MRASPIRNRVTPLADHLAPNHRKHSPSFYGGPRPPGAPERGESSPGARPVPCVFFQATPLTIAAPRLQLQKHMLEDKLNDKISHRPAPEELIKDGVLLNDPRAAEKK